MSLTTFVISIALYGQLQRLPVEGRKRPESYGRRRGNLFVMVLGSSVIAFILVGRLNGPLSDALIFSLLPGLIIGGCGFVTWTYLIKGKNSFCPNCVDYEWFRPVHEYLFCINCGSRFSASQALHQGSLSIQLDPTPGERILRLRPDIASLGVKTPKCKTCGLPMKLTNADAFGGTAGSVSISFFKMPCFACPQCNSKKFPGSDFGMHLLEEILDGVPRIETEGKARSKMICPYCKNQVDVEETRGIFGLQITLDGLDPFLVDISMPSTRCKICQHQIALLTRDMKSTVADAVLNSFDSISLSR